MSKPYRLLITGSRDWSDEEAVRFEIAGMTMLHPGLVIVHGACPKGADLFAAKAAADIGVRQEPHPADWQRDGKRAGFIRNQAMVDLGADVCLAFVMPCSNPRCRNPEPHDSHGAGHCAAIAAKDGIPVHRFTP